MSLPTLLPLILALALASSAPDSPPAGVPVRLHAIDPSSGGLSARPFRYGRRDVRLAAPPQVGQTVLLPDTPPLRVVRLATAPDAVHVRVYPVKPTPGIGPGWRWSEGQPWEGDPGEGGGGN